MIPYSIIMPRSATQKRRKTFSASLRERFENGADSLGEWKYNPGVRTQRI